MEMATEIDKSINNRQGLMKFSQNCSKNHKRGEWHWHNILECMRLKVSQTVMIPEPGKPAEYQSCLRNYNWSVSNQFVNIPDIQFWCRNIRAGPPERTLMFSWNCCCVLSILTQALDHVWYELLMHVMSKIFPDSLCKLLELYMSDRKFKAMKEDVSIILNPLYICTTYIYQ